MGRAERRQAERRNRIEERKGKIIIPTGDLIKMKQETVRTTSSFDVEVLMTCFALAEHRLYGYGCTRIMRSLNYIDELMGEVFAGNVDVDDYKRELREETGVVISC